MDTIVDHCNQLQSNVKEEQNQNVKVTNLKINPLTKTLPQRTSHIIHVTGLTEKQTVHKNKMRCHAFGGKLHRRERRRRYTVVAR